MSVLIQGMEMPESCSVCKLSVTTERYELVCKLLNCYASDGDRETECPLIEIPPHGRVIDADALEDFVIALKRDAIHAYEWTGKSGEWNTRIFERERFAQAIEDAPTIIPADKED